MSVPLALVSWMGVVLLTGALPVSWPALALVLPLLAVAVTLSVAPLIWLVARRFSLSGAGERSAIALRLAFWLGLWVTACVGLRIANVFSWLVAITFAAILSLIETFLQQSARR